MALADTIANIFHHYGMNCLELMKNWEQQRLITRPGSAMHNEEKWQLHLWRYIFCQKNYNHLSRLLNNIIENKEKFQHEPCRIILFGSLFLGEAGLKFFHYLSQQMDVHHFILSPSPEIQPQKIPYFSLNNCRLFRDFYNIIDKLEIRNTKSIWKLSSKNNAPHQLLQKLQSSLFENSEMKEEICEDDSIEIHAVCGAKRTIEVLKDRILQAIRDDPTLQPTQIGILAPDISRFAPHIEVIFPKGEANERLEFNLIDLAATSNSPYQAAFRQLMELPGSPFGCNSLLELFANPCFTPCINHPELKTQFKVIMSKLNIRWGLDRKHRTENGIFHGLSGSWELAINRLVTGYFQSEDDVENIKPVNQAGSTEESGTLIHILRGLEHDLRNLHRQTMTLQEWIINWEKKVEKWLSSSLPTRKINPENEHFKIKSMFRHLMNLKNNIQELRTFNDDKLPWNVFKSILGNHLDSLSGQRGRYLNRGVTGSSLKPMRAIPFRRIYLLGMDEGEWPGRNLLPAFDLRESIPRWIDLSRESADSFAFIETILSAEEHISFFISGRQPSNDEVIPPSSCLVELLAHLGPGAEKLIHKHPLSSIDPGAFTGKGKIATSSSSIFKLARALQQKPKNSLRMPEPHPAIPSTTPTDTKTGIKKIELFLKNPVEYFFRSRLGLNTLSEENELPEEDPLESEFLDWWNFCRNTIVHSPTLIYNTSQFMHSFSIEAQMEARLADVPLKQFHLQKLEAQARSLSNTIQSLGDADINIEETFQCRFLKTLPLSPQEITNTHIKCVQAPAVTLSSTIPGSTNTNHWISGDIPGLHTMKQKNGTEIWCMIDYSHAKTIYSKIKGWLAALMLGCTYQSSQQQSAQIPEGLRLYYVYPEHDLHIKHYLYSSPHTGSLPPENLPAGSHNQISMSQAQNTLKDILTIMQQAQTEPLPLYPDLAEKMLAEPQPGNPNELALLAAEKWNYLVHNPQGHYRFANCIFRQRYLRKPNFSSPLFFRAWQTLYMQGGLS